jgi:ketosteroid isomerase-like protein
MLNLTRTRREIIHKNAEIVRRGYHAFNTADMKTLTELFDENASWHTPGRGSIAGDRVGRDNVFAQFARYGERRAADA